MSGAAAAPTLSTPSLEISICVPVWNGADYVGALIHSVVRQTDGNWRLYVGDNASSDGLDRVLAAHDDPRIVYRRWERHVGPSENFNRTIALAASEWILPIGVDDALDADAVGRFRAAIAAAQPIPAMVVAPCRRVAPDGSDADRVYYGATPPASMPAGRYGAVEWLRIAATGGPYRWTIGSVVFSRDALVESGAFRPDIGLAADMELIFRLSASGDVVVLDGPVMGYLVHLDSDGNTQWARNLRDRHAEVPLARALLAALDAHEHVRTVSNEERRRMVRGVAGTYLYRAVQHRLHDMAGGRRGALRDVGRAWRTSPDAFLSVRAAATALAAIFAPTTVLRRAAAAMRRSRR